MPGLDSQLVLIGRHSNSISEPKTNLILQHFMINDKVQPNLVILRFSVISKIGRISLKWSSLVLFGLCRLTAEIRPTPTD
jgi:hypothetical protein